MSTCSNASVKSKFAAFNIILVIVLLFALVVPIAYMFGYQVPTDLTTQTGTVSRFYQHDAKWYDNIFSNTKGSYWEVRFEDGSYFEATGIAYEQIDRKLFEELDRGQELTVTYFEKPGGVRKICAIAYKGETYLSSEAVLAAYEQRETRAHIIAPIAIAVLLAVGASLFIINYKKNYRR